VLDADGGCGSAVAAGVWSARREFRGYLPILTGRGFSLRLEAGVCPACVCGGLSDAWRWGLAYGGGAWVEDESR